ncbi:hypothetical protein [Kordia zhangzhouensis]|uniref:hypothetical protein n=1 Tax=Kordia zhangzhouensis TaxID=1620405 RepID=UPI000629234D|nr:hypothetical protein [Kordia zhangzhouensis]
MKKYSLILILILTSCDFNHRNENKELAEKKISQEEQKYRILKIDSIDQTYIIYAKKQDSFYKIVSSKNDFKQDCNKIKVNQDYKLKLESLLYPENTKPRRKFELSGIDYNGITIKVEKDSIKDIHKSSNLNGLCYDR